MSKKIPPYGFNLYYQLKNGYKPKNSINLFVGVNSWQKGESFSQMYPSRTLVLPPWLPPSSYNWPVTQCDILIFDTGNSEEDYIYELVYCLYEHRASIVRYVAPDHLLTVFENN
jgi:hypothetical protein